MRSAARAFASATEFFVSGYLLVADRRSRNCTYALEKGFCRLRIFLAHSPRAFGIVRTNSLTTHIQSKGQSQPRVEKRPRESTNDTKIRHRFFLSQNESTHTSRHHRLRIVTITTSPLRAILTTAHPLRLHIIRCTLHISHSQSCT